MSEHINKFDNWIRERFVEINTELENLYFDQVKGLSIDETIIARLKQDLLAEGRQLLVDLLAENQLPKDHGDAFALLGSIGLYMAACRRHGMGGTDKDRVSPLKEASTLSLRLGSAMGVAPRFVASHLSTANRAAKGRYRSFTSLKDEIVFLDYNTRGVIAYKKAADALLRILPLGIGNPISRDLLQDAKQALDDVLKCNIALNDELDVDRFFYNVRPYYKTYKVGKIDYRGANAGDFAGINEIDMILGLADSQDEFYLGILLEKLPYVLPQDQGRLRECMQLPNLMDLLLTEAREADAETLERIKANIVMFLEVCSSHAEGATYHHNVLIDRYIDKPATDLPKSQFEDVTSSGPPLNVLLDMLAKIRDLRVGADRNDMVTRHSDLEELKKLVSV